MTKKSLIFTGAGMSVPLGLPSTTDFTESVQHGARAVTNHVTKYLGASGEDIEWILSTLQSFTSETTFVEFLLPAITNDQPHATWGSFIENRIAQLRSESVLELTRIKKIIFEKLSEYDETRALSLYLNLIDEVTTWEPNTAISIITTNYDLTFESAIEASRDEWKKRGVEDVDFGFSIQFGRPIYDPSQDFQWKPSVIEYLKIHGSIDWHRDARSNCSRSMSSTVPDDPDQMAILYPGFKGVPEIEPFISMHGRLNRRLAEADNIIVIGFAFRDTYINNIFENMLRLRPDIKVLYYNPLSVDAFPKDSLVPHFIENYSSFRHIKRGIGVDKGSLGLMSG